MTAIDPLARGLAVSATQSLSELSGPDGASLVGEQSGVTVQDRLLEVPPSIYGKGFGPGDWDDVSAAQITAQLQDLFTFSDLWGSVRVGQFPYGEWQANKLVYDEGDSTHSAWFRGYGARFGGQLMLHSAADYQFDIGNGWFDAFHIRLTDQAFSGGNLVTDGVVRLNRGNFLYLRDLHIADFAGAAGLVLCPGDPGPIPLMQEVSLSNVSIVGRNFGSGTGGNVCFDISNTGNIDCFCLNCEFAQIGVRAIAKNALGSFRMFGGWLERIDAFSLELQDQHSFIVADSTSGAVWLGDGCTGCTVDLNNSGGNGAPSLASGVCDNGFGNRIGRVGSLAIQASYLDKSLPNFGHWQDGLEWNRVPGYNPNSFFEAGQSSLSASSQMSIDEVASPLPYCPHSASALRIRANADLAFVEWAFDVETANDQLGMVGALLNGVTPQFTISLLDGAGTVLATRTVNGFDEDGTDSSKHVFRFAKVLATDSQITGPTLRLRVTLSNVGEHLVLWFADVKPSMTRHESDISGSDLASGSNAEKRYRRLLAPGPMSLNGSYSWPSGVGMIVRSQVEVITQGADDGFLGVGGTSNDPAQKQNFRLPSGLAVREWTSFVPRTDPGVKNRRLALYSYNADPDTIEMYETSTHEVFPQAEVETVEASLTGPFGAATTAPLFFPAEFEKALVLCGRLKIDMDQPIAADPANYWQLDLVKRDSGGASATLWSSDSAASGWDTGAPTSIGRADFNSGEVLLLDDLDTLHLDLARVGVPADFAGRIWITLKLKRFRTRAS